MQQVRKTLSVRSAYGADSSEPQASNADIFRIAIDRKLCVTAVYNKCPMLLSPHILYTRHDELFVDAVVMIKQGKVPTELKLGTFKLAGINGASLSGEPFTIQPVFDPNNPKYEGVAVRSVQP